MRVKIVFTFAEMAAFEMENAVEVLSANPQRNY